MEAHVGVGTLCTCGLTEVDVGTMLNCSFILVIEARSLSQTQSLVLTDNFTCQLAVESPHLYLLRLELEASCKVHLKFMCVLAF